MPRYKIRGVIEDGKPHVIRAWRIASKKPTRPDGTIQWSRGWMGFVRNLWDCHVDVIEDPKSSRMARFCALCLIEEDLKLNPRPHQNRLTGAKVKRKPT